MSNNFPTFFLGYKKVNDLKKKLENIYETSCNFHNNTIRNNSISFKCNFMLLRADIEYFTFWNFSWILFFVFDVLFTRFLAQVTVVPRRNSAIKVRWYLECWSQLRVILHCTKVSSTVPEASSCCKHSRILNRARPRTM